MSKKICKTLSKVQIIVLLLSIILLGIATWITTLKVPNCETKILDKDSTISKLRYEITKDLVQGLYTMDVQTEGRIDLLNLHFEKKMNELMTTSKARSKLEQKLLENFFKKTTEQITQWNSLFIIEHKQQTTAESPIFDSNASVEQFTELEHTLINAKKNAYSRLDQLIQKIRSHENQKAKYESNKKYLDTCFRCFQILGLITLMIAAIFEAIRKLTEPGKN